LLLITPSHTVHYSEQELPLSEDTNILPFACSPEEYLNTRDFLDTKLIEHSFQINLYYLSTLWAATVKLKNRA
jgi:hypothetical protein